MAAAKRLRNAESAPQREPAAAAAPDRAGEPRPPRLGVSDRMRGRTRLALIRDLAMGEWSHRELADQLGLTAKEIAAFSEEEHEAITEVKSALAGQLAIETSGLWISKKQNRVAELEALFADNAQAIEYLRSLPITDGTGLGSRRHANLARSQLAILGAAATEYEPRRGTPTAPDSDRNVVHYIIEGLDTESLT